MFYELDTWSQYLNSELILKKCLFGGVKLANNTETDEYVYSGYGVGFNLHLEFSLSDGSVVQMSLFLGLIWAQLFISVNNIKRYLNSWYKSNTRIW